MTKTCALHRAPLIMAALWNRAGHYVFALWFLSFFFLSSSFFHLFSSPNLSGRRLDVYHTSTHGVALVRIKNAGLKYAARGSLKVQDAKNRQKFAIWAPSHKFVVLLSLQLSHISTIGKTLLSSNIFSTCPHHMANFGPLAAEIGSGV